MFVDTESVPRDLCRNPLPVVLSVLSLALVLAAHAAFRGPASPRRVQKRAYPLVSLCPEIFAGSIFTVD